ncbi:MAG: alpha-galactosidase, partial [Lachnospiraceae bacterium]|nr:alpha-galactosidase [Lachnospiraceae bacterium]
MGTPDRPAKITDNAFRFDSFSNGQYLYNKKTGRLPAMGWNSWNAFGSANNEELTKAMADKILELGLDKLGYRYVVLDDGCYKPVRVNGRLSNEETKFPGGFKALGDHLHAMGLKFGMYNDIGTHLCAGANVGTCGFEAEDAKSYVEWGIDFIKVDNCYYLWDDATFSDRENARYTYAPNIKSIKITGHSFESRLEASKARIQGNGPSFSEDHITGIGTFDGTGPDVSPVGILSGEAVFEINVPKAGEYDLTVEYATGREPGVGAWLQVALGEGEDLKVFYDDLLPETGDKETYAESGKISVTLKEGVNALRLMNHRRQENTLYSYSALKKGFEEAAPGNDILLSTCEWGKTQPHNWALKIADSWRILNDISFQVGSPGDPGHTEWQSDYTTSITTQYNKAVIMDEFAGLDKGWNDPDMMVIGMGGITETMSKTHMTMWCMMNSPLMLGLDLRRVQKGDGLYKIIANKDLIDLNQDPLGVQAKRIYSTAEEKHPDTVYLRDNDRVDALAKPLADGSVALAFINLSKEKKNISVSVDIDRILSFLGGKLSDREALAKASCYLVKDLWTGEEEKR